MQLLRWNNPGAGHQTSVFDGERGLDVANQTRVSSEGRKMFLTNPFIDQALAHLDPRTVTNPGVLDANAKLTVADLEEIFEETGTILNEFSRLWQETTSIMRLVDDEDYTSALDLVADAKHVIGLSSCLFAVAGPKMAMSARPASSLRRERLRATFV